MWQKNLIKKGLSWVVVLAIFVYLVSKLLSSWSKINFNDFSFNYFYLFLSVFFWGLGIGWLGICWKKIANFLEPKNDLSYFQAIRLSFYSWIGRYIPGKVFQVFGMTSFVKTTKFSKENLWLSSVIQVLFSVIAMVLVSLLFLIFLGAGYGVEVLIFFLALSAIALIIIFYPKVFNFFVKIFFEKILRKKDVEVFKFGFKEKFLAIVYLSMAPVLRGIGFFFLLKSLFVLPINSFGIIVGVFVFSITAGSLAMFAPAGLGVKEGFLVLSLKWLFPIETAILISFLAMFWSLALDILFWGVAFIIGKIKIKE